MLVMHVDGSSPFAAVSSARRLLALSGSPAPLAPLRVEETSGQDVVSCRPEVLLHARRILALPETGVDDDGAVGDLRLVHAIKHASRNDPAITATLPAP